MLRCGVDPGTISRHSNARFARECQSFLQESQQYECRICESGHYDIPVARNASGAAALCGPTKMEVEGEVQGEGKRTIVVEGQLISQRARRAADPPDKRQPSRYAQSPHRNRRGTNSGYDRASCPYRKPCLAGS
jgi:hypothetical protein